MNKLNLVVLLLLLVFLSSAHADASSSLLAPAATPPLASSVESKSSISPSDTQPKAAPTYLNYNYYGEKYRDPFVPLIGESRSDQTTDRPPAIASLMLKGIVQDNNGRMALLISGVNSYILRAGRLYDGRNHMVKGLSGVIKTESVVIIGSDRTIREIRTKTTL